MMTITRLSAAALVLASLIAVPASAHTDKPDGTLLSDKPCPPNPLTSYDDYVARARAYFASETEQAGEEGIVMPPVSDAVLLSHLEPPEAVAEHIAYDGFECRQIIYASHGLEIAGLLWRPVDTAGKHLPLIIANRGGNRGFGPMDPWRDWGWHQFLRAGYVVLASQYRGGPGSEGEDEFGGADVDDIRALIPLAEGLGYIDTGNVFAFGGSRGGMMTYMLARGETPLRAFAIRAGLSDLFRGVAGRPMFEQMWAQMMPDYASEGRDAAYTRRSAVKWAQEIAIPGIIFHGSDDWRVDPRDALDVVTGMHAAGTPVELHFYYGDTHAMTLNRADMLRHALDFFARFRRAPEAQE